MRGARGAEWKLLCVMADWWLVRCLNDGRHQLNDCDAKMWLADWTDDIIGPTFLCRQLLDESTSDTRLGGAEYSRCSHVANVSMDLGFLLAFVLELGCILGFEFGICLDFWTSFWAFFYFKNVIFPIFFIKHQFFPSSCLFFKFLYKNTQLIHAK